MNPPTFRAEINRRQIWSAMSFALALGIAGAYMLVHGADPGSERILLREPLLFYPFMGLVAVSCPVLAVLCSLKLRGGSPLRVGAEGIGLSGAIRIPWNDIVAVEPFYDPLKPARYGYKIVLKDAGRFLAEHRDHRLYPRMLSALKTLGSPAFVYTYNLRFDPHRFDQVVRHYLGVADRRDA